MAEILPSEMPTSACVVSIAVMIVAFLMMVSKRIRYPRYKQRLYGGPFLGCEPNTFVILKASDKDARKDLNASVTDAVNRPPQPASRDTPTTKLRAHGRIVRQNVAAINLQRLFFFSAHQIDVELRHTDRA